MGLRARLEIGWRDLACAVGQVLWTGSRTAAQREALAAWGREDCLVTLSVRSAFDLALRALRLPAGSEVLLSALTVPDMARIVAAHRLIPVPVDVDARWRIDRDALRRAATARSMLLVVAHLFGDRDDLSDVIECARHHGLHDIEDCAQSFPHVGDPGHAASDLVLHSFGPIKTAKALGGAVARVRSRELRAEMARLVAADPIQSRRDYARRVLKHTLLKPCSGRIASGTLWCVLAGLGVDVDRWLNSLGRGFRGDNLLSQLRRQPATPLLRILARRWRRYDFRRVRRRQELARRLDAACSHPRTETDDYWVYPVLVEDSRAAAEQFRAAGFDATARSRMAVVPTMDAERSPQRTLAMWPHILFVPWYPELTDAAVDQLGRLIGMPRAAVRAAEHPQQSTTSAMRGTAAIPAEVLPAQSQFAGEP